MSVSFRFIYLDLVITYMNIQNVMPKLVTGSHKYSYEHIRIGKHDARMPEPNRNHLVMFYIIMALFVFSYVVKLAVSSTIPPPIMMDISETQSLLPQTYVYTSRSHF